ncbi:MAG: hypothetical protein RBS84_08565 [Kiritimatiellia bacterium]|jgi:hypothetical protein|nr:hypothetical protein [Kiritimatiellia bacterium]
MNGDIQVRDSTEAQREFSKLVEEQAACCLWFLQEPRKISVMDPAAETVLNAIIRHGTQPAWQQAKELQAWRFHNIK